MNAPVQLVAIGASAGGIDALRRFFEVMPADSGLAFVIILHLSPDRESMLTEILGRWTAMPVNEAHDGDRLRPGQVHVIPPAVLARLKDGRLRLERMPSTAPRPPSPIDTFFDSAAADLGGAVIGIVLSGTGHDGSLGMKAIKSAGGVTMAQVADGSAPEHSGMPDSAIATGAVDLAVGVDEMPAHLMAFRRGAPDPLDEGKPDLMAARLEICRVLLDRVGHDFSGYKDKTFLRRVERRMQVVGESTLPGYVERISSGGEEALMLFRDLLIGVTQFFRDAATFAMVEEKVIPRLFEGKGASDTVRVWVPGCATGEEAYSLAILLREHMDRLDMVPKVQLFATDIDGAAIGTARAGRYPPTLLEGMSAARLTRFFVKSPPSYTIAREIRDLCTFSPHSLVRDPPFSRMDLVSCRNLLIYMDAGLQATIIPSFHYSLVPGGILLLGSSETVVRHETLFQPIEKHHRIFQRREGPSPPLRAPSALPTHMMHTARPHGPPPPLTPPDHRGGWMRSVNQAQNRVLDRFAAPFAVLTAEGELLHHSSRFEAMMQPPESAIGRNVFEVLHARLFLPLRSALRAAVAGGQPLQQVITLETEQEEKLNLVVEPLGAQSGERCYLIVLQPEGATLPPRLDDVTTAALVQRMESEMTNAREDLQSLTEEHETALEELRSSNEELNSVNEELQSSNEELQTSKEEIQSINEELQTVNAQLFSKIDELDRVNGDLKNLFESTKVATIVLDAQMKIRNFTPEISRIYNLIPGDRGRSVNDIVSALNYGGLRDDVEHVLSTGEPIERGVARRDGTAHYLCRILPYSGPEAEVEGTLVTFVEVTNLVRAEAQQRVLIDELNHRVKNMLAVVTSLAQQTADHSPSLEAFRPRFLGRLSALSTAYGLLSREKWTSVRLAELFGQETAPFLDGDDVNITLDGPDLFINANAALVLGMAVHELVTNAVKYGALSRPGGRVAIVWQGAGDQFTLNWTETGGPPPTAPATQGFGMMLITRSVEHELEGTVRFTFAAEGLGMRLQAPLAALSPLEPPAE